MIKLFQFPALLNVPNLSPFCMKLETYLRMTKIPYEVVSVMNPSKAPKGKLPYIRDGNTTIADTHFIIQYLNNKYGDILDGHLTPKEKALSSAIEKLIEEHLYWIIVYSRWIDPTGWRVMKPIFFSKVSTLSRGFLAYMIRRQVRRKLHAQGMGRHKKEEIYALGCEDLDSLAALLNHNDYLMSNTPTSVDASCYAFLTSIRAAPFDHPLKTHLEANPKLIQYCQRMKKRFFTDTTFGENKKIASIAGEGRAEVEKVAGVGSESVNRVMPYVPRELVKPLRLINVPTAWDGVESILKDVIHKWDIFPGTALEFGVDYGYSTAALANFFNRVIGVDHFQGDHHAGYREKLYKQASRALRRFKNVELRQQDYRDFIYPMGQNNNSRYDLIHIDIVHDYKPTKEAGTWAVQRSDVVMFHDVLSFPDVKRAVLDIAEETGRTYYEYAEKHGVGFLVKE